MLRTNEFFLPFIDKLYEQQTRGDDITLKTYMPGELVLQQDKKARHVHLLKTGISKCFISAENGKEYIFEFMGQGQIIGELEAIRNMNCLCNIEAITPVSAYAVSISLFKSLLQEEPEFNRMIINEMAERVYNTCQRISWQQSYTLEHVLKKLLQLQEAQQLRLSKENMAGYLGVTIRSLNRALKNL
ncbi:Crp/Fnr family transcriptional regulator [Chitinophaga sp. Hz27]|uniref:Crp/Fnr family transcriptional regulator n=1 Tax=Chitinophaga sp. Hz27 TaxID=3347169 RepID=UPI0035DB126B